MHTSVRFRRPRGDQATEPPLARTLVSAASELRVRLGRALPRYLAHLVVVVASLLMLYPLAIELPPGYDHLRPAVVVRIGHERESGRSVSSRGGEVFLDRVQYEEPAPRGGPYRPVEDVLQSATSFLQAPVVHTTIPERPRREVITHVVQDGDSVLDIATRFGLHPETVTWANGELERDPDLLRLGQELVILPINGVYHTVVDGDTLSSLASKYGVRVEDILDCEYNDIALDRRLEPGQKLIVPGGTKPYIPRQVTAYQGPIPEDALRGTGVFMWPTSGHVTDRFGYKTYSGRWHTGIDISGDPGTPIYAADAGFVTFTGMTKRGYGKLVIVDHGNGYVTYYAHLSVIYVSMGQSVNRGALIAAMGSTGNSTGTHLHFEIRHKGVPCDPEANLP